ncbi:acid sugar phosphatase [Nocardioides psychrotolerans]|uniref:Haloacid Dehalogenase Superfamily Class (Subfamily) IIA n=1 Tax=Nocardioides psychrotolerans TaxID=1005945 RepID=A0A1I3HLZ9_9ACTN|nr:HAD-IIA family hydrolase [Nocardioides psychrotolerans]GEP40022.1 acid sugar phosphatase [Nocardioides psychrotolerans]SFI36617.1 Haloacid Dehalogenase Superfamily Class (subfamily) IIA [Nocardioides psychrotolerans]
MSSTVQSLPEAPSRLYDAYLFDLDGTIYLGDELLPGAFDLVTGLRDQGCETLFLSNNPTRDPQMYAEKLTRLGLPTPTSHIVNPVVTLTAWLRQEAPDATVFVIGEDPLVRALQEAGVRTSNDPALIDIVVASFDRTFDYAKLQIAFDALWQHGRARLVTTNPDAYCPMPGGRGEPDAAAVIAAIEASTGVRCEVNVGKPSPLMLTTALSVVGIPATDCLMVGDRLYTDIAMAVDAGIDSALVLSGESTRAMLADLPVERHPTLVLDRIDALLTTRVVL